MIRVIWIFALLILQLDFINAMEPKKIRLVSTANVHGETDPCG